MVDDHLSDQQDMPARKRPKRLTLSHMAEELGISTATVSLALRDSPLVAKETLEKVKQYAEQSGYIYNRSAASLRTSRTNTVGVAVHDIQNPYFAEIFRSLENELEKNRQTIFICNHRDSHDRQKAFVDALMQHRADGLILCPSVGTTKEDIETIAAQGLPLTLISRDVPGASAPVVRGNDYTGAKALGEHLIERGHRRIGFIGGRQGTTAWEERHRGWHDALQEAGIDVGAMFDVSDLMTQADGREVVPRLLARKPRPTAIFAFNDMVALGLMSSLRRAGVAPGRDIAVAGYDDNDGSEAHVPALTSVWNAPEHIGEKAASLMLAQIAGEDLGDKRILFEPELRIRESSLFAPAAPR